MTAGLTLLRGPRLRGEVQTGHCLQRQSILVGWPGSGSSEDKPRPGFPGLRVRFIGEGLGPRFTGTWTSTPQPPSRRKSCPLGGGCEAAQARTSSPLLLQGLEASPAEQPSNLQTSCQMVRPGLLGSWT